MILQKLCVFSTYRMLQSESKQGAGSLGIHLVREERYFKGVAQLAQEWHLRPAPEFNFQAGIWSRLWSTFIYKPVKCQNGVRDAMHCHRHQRAVCIADWRCALSG